MLTHLAHDPLYHVDNALVTRLSSSTQLSTHHGSQDISWSAASPTMLTRQMNDSTLLLSSTRDTAGSTAWC